MYKIRRIAYISPYNPCRRRLHDVKANPEKGNLTQLTSKTIYGGYFILKGFVLLYSRLAFTQFGHLFTAFNYITVNVTLCFVLKGNRHTF